MESRLITCGNRIIVPREMRPEMPQYIHNGHQGKERCLLWARNTVFWSKMTYDVQELIERCIICQEHGRSQPIIGTQELPPFPWHTLATDIFYWKRMDFLIVADVFSKYFLVRILANSTSAAICAELATIVTELGLPHIIRSDNGPCSWAPKVLGSWGRSLSLGVYCVMSCNGEAMLPDCGVTLYSYRPEIHSFPSFPALSS